MALTTAGAVGVPSPRGEGSVIRVVTEGAPWPGTIVREDDGSTTLHVDAALLAETTLWCAAADGHLLTPLDIVRTAAGHEAVFPLCQRRLDEVLRERIAAGTPPSAGECVTVAVSLLRGTAESADAAAGRWWLTDDGRPVLAIGGGDGVRDAALDIFTLLEEGSTGPMRDALNAAADAIADPRGDLVAAEDALFAVSEPAALVTTALAPARARSVATALRVEPAPPRSALRAAVARHVDADVAERVMGARDDLRERWAARRERRAESRDRRAEGRTRRREHTAAAPLRPGPTSPAAAAPRSRRLGRAPLLAGATVAALVIGAGLLWPTADASTAGPAVSDPAPAPAPTESTTEGADGSPTAGQPAADPTATPPADAPTDAPTLADELLTQAAACPDEACRDALRETPGRPSVDGVLGLAAPEREITLVEDYGGVAVLRVAAVTAGTAPDRLLVIVQTAQKWLIRDAYDVADQP
ncbi:hypothetical protein H9651_09060 [Microbacterium sp. Sa4CUA7]|uniref:Uncharacterized protein n=1 Tax=Microbacterium pullorum TaxID=2762236 RepID=A0ABR8S2Q9_9MICO|nr:hypothetical protein [Microbacterium pullorum]MBD7957787.1 hypothetical protein [Microbacterium pullorum]